MIGLVLDAALIETGPPRGLKFFKEGEQLDDGQLPGWMNTDEMRQAMNTLRQFSEKERGYHAYQSRQNDLREQHAIQQEREQIHKELEQERQEKQVALQREEVALPEIERLKVLLAGKF